jgi:antitoxin component YwqK of YwqJK toxin-antitoxin module
MTTERPKNGPYTEYYDNGQIEKEENSKDGK